MPSSHRTHTASIRFLGKVILAFLLVTLFFVKVRLFDFGAYTSDLFSHLQISQSWLQGKKLLYENCYGDHSLIHNYYLVPLLGIFTLWTGAYGLFIVHIAFTFLVLALLWDAFCNIYPDKHARRSVFMLIFCLFFGPAALYIWDNPGYGWHTEMLYVPLSILFIYSLYRKRIWLIILSGLLLTINKEDGAVIGACLSLGWLWTGYYYRAPQKVPLRTQAGAYIKTLACWVAIFALGMLLLGYKTHFETTRVGFAFSRLPMINMEGWRIYFKPMFTAVLFLLLPAWLYLWLVFGWRQLLACILLSLPLLIVELIASLVYFPELLHGLTWVPRFALLWAFTAGFIIMQWLCKPRKSYVISRYYVYAFICIGLLCLQNFVLTRFMQYRALKIVYTTFQPQSYDRGDEKEMNFMRRLSRHIPKNWQVAPRFFYFDLFPYQTIYWLDHPKTDEGLYPDIIITDWPQDPSLQQPAFGKYYTYYYGKLLIKVKPDDVPEWNSAFAVSK